MSSSYDEYQQAPPETADGIPKAPKNAFDQSPDGRQVRIFWPVTAAVITTYYCNDPKNDSLRARQAGAVTSVETAVVTEVVTGEESKEYVDDSQPVSIDAGSQFMCDLQIEKGFGIANRDLFRPKVPVCNAFGGFKNFGFVTPTGTTNTSIDGNSDRFNGDKVVVQFIGGDIDRPLITGYYPHPANVIDGPRFYPGDPQDGAYFRINGTEAYVDHDGDFIIDTRNAGNSLLLDAGTGVQTPIIRDKNAVTPEALDPPGKIEVMTYSNQLYDASYSAEDKDAAYGDITLQCKTEGTFKSKKEDIKIYTDDFEKDVILQGPHGGTRPAARFHDKIKITSGNSNDLFQWCARVSNVLNEVGSYLIMAGEAAGLDNTDLIYAGNLLNGLGVGFPTYAEGRIIEGSPYVQIAGTMTSQDEPSEEVVEKCTSSTKTGFAKAMSGSACAVNDIADYFATLDTLADIVKLLEIPTDPATGLPIPLFPPLSFIQILPANSSDEVKAIKPCLLKWLATCPKTEWPPKFQAILNLIFHLTSLDKWIDLFTDADKFAAAFSAIYILIGGSACDLFDISNEETILETEIAAGTADTTTNGALTQAVDECVDEDLAGA